MEISLPGKVALVTGGASGIGRAISQILAESGARVAVADINLDAAKEVAEMLGSGAIAIGMDVADEASVAAGFSACRDTLGPLDVLVSNAGIQIIGALDRFSFADWKRLMAVNLDGAFLTTREALRQMYPDRRGGSIIYIGSAHSHMASILKAPYVTAKHGLIGLARAVAKDGLTISKCRRSIARDARTLARRALSLCKASPCHGEERTDRVKQSPLRAGAHGLRCKPGEGRTLCFPVGHQLKEIASILDKEVDPPRDTLEWFHTIGRISFSILLSRV